MAVQADMVALGAPESQRTKFSKPYFSTETAAAAPLLRALVRNTGTSQAAITLTVTAVVLAP